MGPEVRQQVGEDFLTAADTQDEDISTVVPMLSLEGMMAGEEDHAHDGYGPYGELNFHD